MTPAGNRRFNPMSLDAINFLLADVRGSLGPYLNVFLVTQQHWSQSQVGWVTTIGGLLSLAVQTPIGAAIDETRAKRGAIVLALAVLGIGAAIIYAWPSFWPVFAVLAGIAVHSIPAGAIDLDRKHDAAVPAAGPAGYGILVGRTADTWGRKPLFLAGFAILPIRAVLYTLSDNSFWLVGVQVLDGVGAGIFGALTPLVIADIMRGTGRYNLAQSAIATMVGV